MRVEFRIIDIVWRSEQVHLFQTFTSLHVWINVLNKKEDFK